MITEEIAKYVAVLRMGNPQHSLRRIAELVCDNYPEWVDEEYGDKNGSPAHLDLRGNQLMGKDLVEMAGEVLGITSEELIGW